MGFHGPAAPDRRPGRTGEFAGRQCRGCRQVAALETRRADLELRHAAGRIQRGVGEQVRRRLAAPVERHEDGVDARAVGDDRLHRRRAAPGADGHDVARAHAVLARRRRVQFETRCGRTLHEFADAPRLGPRLVLREHATGREVERIVAIGQFGGTDRRDDVEDGASVRGGKPIPEEARRAGMPVGRAGPVQLFAGVEARVADAAVVGAPTRARPPEFLEDGRWVPGREALAAPEACGERRQHLEIGAHAGGWREHPAAPQHAPLEVRHRPVLLGPHRHRQHDVGDGRRLRQEEVTDDEQVERAQAARDAAGVGCGDDRVGADHEQPAWSVARAERVEQFEGRKSRLREIGGVDAPHGRDVGAGLQVAQRAIARQLVGFLSVFASALAVALPREAAEPAAAAADLPERERDVDEGERVGHALRLLFSSARGEDHRRASPAQQVRGTDDVRLGHAGDALDAPRPVRGHRRAHLVESSRAGGDVRRVDQPVTHEHVQQPVGEHAVGSRHEGEVQRGSCGGRRASWVDDDQLPAGAALRVEVLHRRGQRLGHVAADEEDHVGVGDVRERERQPTIDAEGRVGGGGRRCHAEPAVVVDVASAERDPRELAEQVALLVGQRAAAEDAHGVASVGSLEVAKAGGDAIERLVPAHRRERPVRVPGERRRQPVGMRECVDGRPPLDAERAAVHREARVARHHRRASRSFDPHAALQRAVRAVSLDAGVWSVRGMHVVRCFPAPPTRRRHALTQGNMCARTTSACRAMHVSRERAMIRCASWRSARWRQLPDHVREVQCGLRTRRLAR